MLPVHEGPLPVVGDFLFWLVIFFGFVLWDFLISEDFIFEVSSQSLKRGEAEKMEI